MRDDRYSRGSQPDSTEDLDYQVQINEEDSSFDQSQSAGFTHYQMGSTRRTVSMENPASEAARRVGGAVGGFVGNISSRVRGSASDTSTTTRSGRTVPTGTAQDENGDYLGVGHPCRVCGNPVDDSQTRCPHCGAFVRPLYTNVWFWVALVVLVAIIVLLAVGINSCVSSNKAEEPAVVEEPEIEVPDTTALGTAVSSAQAILADQQNARSATRLSLRHLQEAVTNAETVLSDSTSTNEQITAAADQISSALAGFESLAENYAWPSYVDMTMPTDNMLGEQVAVSGQCQWIVYNEGSGTMTAALAMDNNPDLPVYIEFYNEDADTDVLEGGDYAAYGVIVGNSDGGPVILADRIEGL